MIDLEQLLARLRAAQFQVENGPVEPFGETLPLVKAIAWDRQTAQLALVASPPGEPPRPEARDLDLNSDGVEDEARDAWRQLLFAVSGLRHQLRGDRAPALATPVLFALVPDAQVSMLRSLATELADSYSLFTRVELNIVETSRDADELDLCLAPMLPKVREALREKQTVAPADVERFWAELKEQIRVSAEKQLPDASESQRRRLVERLVSEIEPKEGSKNGAPLRPLGGLSLTSFRSFASESLELAPVTIVDGPNGSGKSSVIEALELLWSETTQRMRPDEDPAVYTRHAGKDGETFRLSTRIGDRELVRAEVKRAPVDKLARAVLAQDSLARMASERPGERFDAFLQTTGLQVPEVEKRIKSLHEEAKRELDAQLAKAQIKPLPAINRRADDHVARALSAQFAAGVPAYEQLAAVEETLAAVSHGSYRIRDWSSQAELQAEMTEIDSQIASAAVQPERGAAIGEALDGAAATLDKEVAPMRQRATALGRLYEAPRQSPDAGAEQKSPLSAQLTVRWRTHIDNLARSITQLREEEGEIEDPAWRERLDRYLGALEDAVEAAPLSQLRQLSKMTATERSPSPPLGEEVYLEAGFHRFEELNPEEHAALGQLCETLNSRAEQLERLAARLRGHSIRDYVPNAAAIHEAFSYYELLRGMSLADSPLVRAKTSLVEEMLSERVFPILRELVAALVRFEWYFEPLRMGASRKGIEMQGIATKASGLDIRLLLNAAERSVVGIAWFLTLYLLQPENDRRVLVLDDPAGGFDAVNRAGFVATLRSVLRIACPEQVLITTHDPIVGDLIEEELAPVAGWPVALKRVKCRRDGEADSVFDEAEPQPSETDLERELLVLGLASPTQPDPAIP